jgi:hypothetical protein
MDLSLFLDACVYDLSALHVTIYLRGVALRILEERLWLIL